MVSSGVWSCGVLAGFVAGYVGSADVAAEYEPGLYVACNAVSDGTGDVVVCTESADSGDGCGACVGCCVKVDSVCTGKGECVAEEYGAYVSVDIKNGTSLVKVPGNSPSVCDVAV